LIEFMPTEPTTAGRAREKRDPLATRRALMAAGSELFSERGFDGVALEDLAAKAGFNKALVSYHFGGKRGLYVAILDSSFAAMAERLKAIESGAPSAREALCGYLRAFEQMTRERPGFPTLFLREVLCTGIEPSVVPHLLEIIGVSRRLAERGAREGLFRRVDPMLMHFGLIGSLVFFFATEPARLEAVAKGDLPFAMPSSDAFVRYLADLTLKGLAPEASSPKTPAPESRSRKGARS
jgi:TetR/AcrR family transcriptional regulator